MGAKVGKLASVKYNGAIVSEMGVWSIDGMTNDVLETTEFGDEFKSFEFGVGDSGTVSFNGNFDATGGASTTGQMAMMSAFMNKSKLGAALRFYVDAASYFTADLTNDSNSAFLLQSCKIDFDKSGIGKISFVAKVSGRLIETAGA